MPFHRDCLGYKGRADVRSGNLSNKSLTTIVDPSLLVQDSEYLETHLVAVPNTIAKEFMKSYETLSPMVVPRSALSIASDDEFTLYAVTTFKKHSQEFLHKSREHKWTPRDYQYIEGGKEAEQKEVDRVAKDERKVWGEALRLGRTAWGEAVMAWVHVLTLRVFVETVLRYGLPLSFVCGLIKVCDLRPILSLPVEAMLNLALMDRRLPSSRKKPETRLIPRIPTLLATRSDETKRAGPPKTIRRRLRTCKPPGILATRAITRHTYAMSLRSGSHKHTHLLREISSYLVAKLTLNPSLHIPDALSSSHQLPLQKSLPLQVPHYLHHRLLHPRLRAPHYYLRSIRLFVRRTHPGKIFNLPLPGFRIQALGVARLSYGERNLYVYFHKWNGAGVMQRAGEETIGTVWGDERCESDGARVGEEKGDLCERGGGCAA